MIRLLLDQGLPRSTCAALPQSDWDVLHVGDIGMSRATDRAILEFAANDDRVIVTLDADFHAYLALSGAIGPSVVRIRIEGLQGAALAEPSDEGLAQDRTCHRRRSDGCHYAQYAADSNSACQVIDSGELLRDLLQP